MEEKNKKKNVRKESVRKGGFGFDLEGLKEVLKEPFMDQALPLWIKGALIILFGAGVLYYAAEYSELHRKIIVEITNELINAAKGPRAGISREIFNNLENLFKENNIELIDQIRALEAIERRIIRYIEITALNDNEGLKFDHILQEIRKLIEIKKTKE